MQKNLTRQEQNNKFKWSIEDIFESDKAWEKAFDECKTKINDFKKFSDNLTIDNLYECLTERDEISRIVENVYVYANLKANEDSTNTFYQELTDKADGLITIYSSALSFIEPAVLSMDENALTAALEGELKMYKHHINDILRNREHILSADKEELLAQVYEIASSPSNIFYMLNNADIDFGQAADSKGNMHNITHGSYSTLLESSDRVLRKNAFEKLYSTYYKQKNTLAAIYSSSVKKDVFSARVRNYKSCLESMLFANNIPTEVYTNLIDTVNKYLPLLHRYVNIRKKMLGLDDMSMYDLYTPIVPDVDTPITYEEAKATVLKAVKPLGEEYCAVLNKALNEERWVDIYENVGKRSGAYSWGAYGNHPFVSLNYANNLDSMFTLAHEMGHAMHSYYTWSNQPVVYGDYTIFVAEVASTVNESLLMQYLLKTTDDKNNRMYLLNHFMDQFKGTLFRQTMFAEFELKTHTMAENGEALTFDNMSEFYYELNKKYYGDSVISNEEIKYEWARIPHFYTAYYVYQYATGYSAAIALSNRILNENGTEDYINFLKGGSSKYSIDLLKGAGVDMTTPEPVEKAMSVFESILDEMEANI